MSRSSTWSLSRPPLPPPQRRGVKCTPPAQSELAVFGISLRLLMLCVLMGSDRKWATVPELEKDFVAASPAASQRDRACFLTLPGAIYHVPRMIVQMLSIFYIYIYPKK